MPSSLKRMLILAVCFAACLAASAQSLEQILQPSSSPAKPSNAPADPLGRSTPSGTVFGFLQAAQSGNYSIAAQYLQMSPARRQSEGEPIARKLQGAMDRALTGGL